MKTISEDFRLLKGMKEDDNLSFEAIYNKYSRELFLYGVQVIKDQAICEDIIQDVFVSLWTKRKECEIISLKSYLFQAVKYQIFNHFRNKKFSNEDLTRLNVIDASMNARQKLEYFELDQIIRNYVTKLPDRCQQIFILSRYQDKSNTEIAKELNISVQAVKNQISKALAFLRTNIPLKEVFLLTLILQH